MVNKIKEKCKERGLSLAELERRANVSFVRRWDNHSPAVDKAYRVAKVLGTTVEALLEDE